MMNSIQWRHLRLQRSTFCRPNHVVGQNLASKWPTTDPRPVLETARGGASNGTIRSKSAPFSKIWQSIHQERWLVCHKVQLTSIKADVLLCQAVHAKKSMTSSNNRDASWNPLLLPITEHEINTRPTQLRQSRRKRKKGSTDKIRTHALIRHQMVLLRAARTSDLIVQDGQCCKQPLGGDGEWHSKHTHLDSALG